MNNNRFINPSGFFENLPEGQVIEDKLKAGIKRIAESYGYMHLETASVEYMETLASKGDVNKEIYTIGRALAEGDKGESERGLHFDLTVPFARYVAQNQGNLWFPYRRYQIQKVWRGERPQKGRFREFYQADIDVVTQGNLSIEFDAEIAIVMANIIGSFGLGSVTMHINNRKFLNGLFEFLEIDDTEGVLQTIDKLDKVGESEVKRMLLEDKGISKKVIDILFQVISKKIPANQVKNFLDGVVGEGDKYTEGKTELREIFELLNSFDVSDNVSFVFNPSIARGLDYYTGTVYETTVDGLEQYGSICSGGRYADLASRFTNQKLPGVGMSIGLTRLLAILREENLLAFDKSTLSQVVVCLLREEQLVLSLQVAERLRKNNLNVEVNYKHNVGLRKQIDTAKQKGIPYAMVCEQSGKVTLFDLAVDDKQEFESVDRLIEFLLESAQTDLAHQ